MPHCPNCFTEYVEGATECVDCRVALEPGSPPPALPAEEIEPDAHLAPVRVFRGLHAQFQADLARNVLAEEGIPSAIIGDLAAEMLPGADAVQLLVRTEDEGRASAVLRDLLESAVNQPEPEDPVDPGEGS
jgi:Putative prokaryotic signal transducing protein